jgi:hypothetical protein
MTALHYSKRWASEMPDSVFDATAVKFANGDIGGRQPGNVFDRRLAAIEEIVSGARRLRYNPKLLREYTQLVREHRNDVIEALFSILDDAQQSVRVNRNQLSRQDYAKARDACRWPSHDQHLLAAAVGGDNPTVFVTEQRHAQCAAAIHRHFEIRIEDLG